MRSRRLMTGCVLCFISQTASAADVWHTSSIKTIYPRADGSFVLTFDSSHPACTAAQPDKYHYVMVGQNNMTAEGAKNIYAAAILAIAMDKQVQVNFSDDTPYCYVNRIFVVK